MALPLRKSVQEAIRLTFAYPKIGVPSTDYDAYWRDKRPGGFGELNSFQRFRLQWIEKRVEIGSSVLDIGCGDGAILLELKRRRKISAFAADLSPLALEYLRSQGVEGFLMDGSSEQQTKALPEVDHIILFEVLEHLQNPEKLLADLLPKARKSIFFSIPNSGYFPYRLRLLLGSSFMQWRIHPGEHLRFWTLRDLRWWLDQLGLLNQTELRLYEGLPILNRLWPSMFGMGIIGEISK